MYSWRKMEAAAQNRKSLLPIFRPVAATRLKSKSNITSTCNSTKNYEKRKSADFFGYLSYSENKKVDFV